MLRILVLHALLPWAVPALAVEEKLYNRVDFSSEATRKINNNLLLAQMSIEVNDQSPARRSPSCSTPQLTRP